MAAEVVPLFPLNHVLLPGMPLPLHVFEPRYRDLLADITGPSGDKAFGVVALRRGSEVRTPRVARDGLPDVEQVGTLAEIIENEPRGDGSSDVLTIGSRRFRIASLLPDGTAYLRGMIEYLDEPEGELTPATVAGARRLLEHYDAILLRVAGRTTGTDLPTDPTLLSYQIAARLPLPPGERQVLLRAATTAQRLDRLTRLLHREIGLLQGTRSIAVSPAVLRLATSAN